MRLYAYLPPSYFLFAAKIVFAKKPRVYGRDVDLFILFLPVKIAVMCFSRNLALVTLAHTRYAKQKRQNIPINRIVNCCKQKLNKLKKMKRLCVIFERARKMHTHVLQLMNVMSTLMGFTSLTVLYRMAITLV